VALKFDPNTALAMVIAPEFWLLIECSVANCWLVKARIELKVD
jgi:hypothetical protein